MNSRLWLPALLAFCATWSWAMGDQETVYSLNGQPFLIRQGVLVDEAHGDPRPREVPVVRPRYYQGGSGVARGLLHVAAFYLQYETKVQEDFVFEPLASSLAAKALLNGQLDWAMMSRDLLQAEKDAGLVSTTVAWDGLFVAVAADLPLESLPLRKLAAIYVGVITNWKEVGGPDLPIVPLAYSELSGNAGALRDLVLERVYGDDGKLTPKAVLLDYDQDIFRKIEGRPGAIGFGLDSLDAVERGPKVKYLKIDNIDNTPDEIFIGRYPLSRPLNFVTVGEPQGRARDILDWLLGERLQAAVRGLNLIPGN